MITAPATDDVVVHEWHDSNLPASCLQQVRWLCQPLRCSLGVVAVPQVVGPGRPVASGYGGRARRPASPARPGLLSFWVPGCGPWGPAGLCSRLAARGGPPSVRSRGRPRTPLAFCAVAPSPPL